MFTWSGNRNEKDSENETGIKLENLPKLQNGEIVLQKVYITMEGNIHRLTGKVNNKEYTFLELIRRGHFDECANFMMDNFWKIKPPSIVGRIFRKTFDIGKFEGLIIAWDPQNIKKYEVAYCDGDSEWITEEQTRKKGSLQKKPNKVHMIHNAIRKDTVKVLVLCSGTKSVEDALYQRFHNVIETTGIDINPIFCPDICVDICKWDYKSSYPKNYFDVIWASPDCSQYSKSHTIGERQIEKADNLVLSCLEIIKYFNPHIWVIENSDGALKTRSFMKGWNNYKMKCSYCCYGFCYQKHTNIWTNAQVTLKMCSAETPCKYRKQAIALRNAGESSKETPLHPCIAQHGYTSQQPYQIPMQKLQLYTIPPKLINSILGEAIANLAR